MNAEFSVLLATALTLGVGHTAIGVDHTLPFIVLGRARHWSLRRTLAITAICGLGHVLSSVVIGYVGWGFGATLGHLTSLEASRGSIAAWLLIAFGTAYAIFGWLRLGKDTHKHVHVHPDGTVHSHGHDHAVVKERVMHRHPHQRAALPFKTSRLIPALFVVFVMGPCEALLPLMFADSLGGDFWRASMLALAFSGATLATMVTLVTLGFWGLRASHLARFEPHLNWSAGVAIALSGVGIQVLGL